MNEIEIIDKIFEEYHKDSSDKCKEFILSAYKTFDDKMKVDWFAITLLQHKEKLISLTEKVLLDNKNDICPKK